MAREYSDDERAAILAESYALLARDVTDTRQVSEPEMDCDDEMLREALSRPVERRNTRIRREYDEEKARKAAERMTTAEMMASLEARLEDRIYRAVAKVLETFYDESIVKNICEPYEKKFAELEAKIDGMRGRDGVSVVGAAVNHKGELMLTLSDGTILTPGRVGGGGEVVDLPNPLAARRVR